MREANKSNARGKTLLIRLKTSSVRNQHLKSVHSRKYMKLDSEIYLKAVTDYM